MGNREAAGPPSDKSAALMAGNTCGLRVVKPLVQATTVLPLYDYMTYYHDHVDGTTKR